MCRVYGKVLHMTQSQQQPTFFSPKQMIQISQNRPQELIADVLPSMSVTVLAGAPGLGKSFVALSWAAAIAEGTPWFGQQVRQAPVAYVLGEGWGGFGRRIDAWEAVNGRPMSNAVHFINGAQDRINLKDSQSVEQLINQLQQINPGLVIVDTFSMLAHVSNENDNAEVAQVMVNVNKIVQATGATVVLIHHVTKTTRSVRGAGAFVGNTDTVIIADRGINTVGSDSNFALTTDNELGGKRRDGTPTTLHGFYVAPSGVLSRVIPPHI